MTLTNDKTAPAPTPPAPTATTTPPWRHSALFPIVLVLVLVAGVVAILYAYGVFTPRPKIALITASDSPFWDMVVQGAQDAAAQQDVQLTVIRSPPDETEQERLVDSLLLAQPFDGVAISPVSAHKQLPMLSAITAKSTLVTMDSDSPVVGRLCYIGTDNYAAGRICGQNVRAAVPDGGEVIIAIGSLDKENGRLRRQGVIDELLGRSFEPARSTIDDPAQPARGERYTVITQIDDLDERRCADMTAHAVQARPNVKCFVGIFAYSVPAILDGLKRTGKLGQVEVVGFDVNEPTLAGIEAGHVHATIMQDQYGFGFEAVRILADAVRGNRAAMPSFQTHHLGVREVTRANVAETRTYMKSPKLSPEPALAGTEATTAPSEAP